MYIVCCHVAPYSGCGYSKRVVEALVRAAGVRNFIETGTFLGHTTRDVAANFPDVNIQTVEVVYSTFKNNEKSFEKFQNIRAVHGESCDFLKEIALEDGPTLYYLDAHWGESHPLREEIGIIVIDDFQVPNRPFGYDCTHTGQIYNMEWIKGILGSEWTYFYKDQQDNNERATGQLFIFHENLNLKRFIKYENGVPYSSLEAEHVQRRSNQSDDLIVDVAQVRIL